MGQEDEVTQYGCWVSLETGQKALVFLLSLLGAYLLGWYAETCRTS